MNEEWRDIKGYEGIYQVSNLGRVKSLDRDVLCKNGKIRHCKGMLLKPIENDKGYLNVQLYSGDTRITCKVHRLVADAFIPNPEGKDTVDHINTIKTDNTVENLRWFSMKEQFNNNEITKERHKENFKKANKACMKKVINLDTMEIFDSIADAARLYNLKNSTGIGYCCRGIQMTAKGCRWAYYDGE